MVLVQDQFKIRQFINRLRNEINRKVLLRFFSPAGITSNFLLFLLIAGITQQTHHVKPLNTNSSVVPAERRIFSPGCPQLHCLSA